LILPLRRIPYTGESRKADSCAAAGSEPATDLPSRGQRSVQCRGLLVVHPEGEPTPDA
jgi:hypothetical protein